MRGHRFHAHQLPQLPPYSCSFVVLPRSERRNHVQVAWPCSARSNPGKAGSRIRPYLMISAMPARNSLSWQGIKCCAVRQYHPGLIKSADHILAKRMVDTRLAANRRVNLRQQRGRNLNKWHATQICGGGEPRQITDNSTTKRDNGGAAFTAGCQQCIENEVQRLPVLVLLAIRKNDRDRRDAMTLQRATQHFHIKWRYRGIGYDRNPLPRQMVQNKSDIWLKMPLPICIG